ncbi:MAG: tRNA epoxyqueuosine(34) reductase QueG [Breznakibacter sp.]
MQLISSIHAQQIRNKAIELGFDAIGFSVADSLDDDAKRLKNWLSENYQAGMAYMANHFEKRTDPRLLVEGAKTVISVIHNYFPSRKPSSDNPLLIARYAYGQDYHNVIKTKLQGLFDYIKQDIYPNLEGRVFTDSAPVLERTWAARAGLGWVGKNGNLIHPKIGSYFFIAELIVNLELPSSNTPMRDYCGGCTKCIDACPTQAIVAPKTIDSYRCISYQTIENKDAIPEEFTGKLQSRIFGCDICQEVCPWNRKAQPHSEPQFEPSDELMAMTRFDWENLDHEKFTKLFKGSAVKRTRFAGLKRNIGFAGL